MKNHVLFITSLLVVMSCTTSEIHYVSSNGKKIKANKEAFNKTIISNTCRNGKGVIKFLGVLEEITCDPFNSAQNQQFDNEERFGNLESISIPDGVNSIGNNSFRGNRNLKEISLPNSIITIGESVCEGCSNLETIKLPQGIQVVGDGIFKGCTNLKNIIIPNNVKNIGLSAFANSGLNCITIPEGVTAICASAFKNCTNLEEVIMSKCKITRIDSSVFEGCTNLKNIIIPNTVEYIERNAFANSGLHSVTIPENVDYISWYAFRNCTNLEKVIMSKCKIRVIGQRAFEGCTNLKNIIIPNNVEHIGDFAFKGCANLKNIIVPNNVKYIGDFAFADSGLNSITFPKSVTEIGNGALSNCSNLKDVYIKAEDILVPRDIIKGTSEGAEMFIGGCRVHHGRRDWDLTVAKDYNSFMEWIKKVKRFYNRTEYESLTLTRMNDSWEMYVRSTTYYLQHYSTESHRINYVAIDPEFHITIGVSMYVDGGILVQIGRGRMYFSSDYI